MIAASFFTACAHSSIHLVKTWISPETTPRTFSNILVVGASDNLERRLIFEDYFAEEFNRHGIVALQSYLVIPTGATLSKKNLKDAARTSGADCVLITRLVNIKKEIKVVPGSAELTFKPVTAYPPPDEDDLSSHPELYFGATVVQEPPTTITNLKVSIETRMFDAKTSSMVWVGETSSGEVYDLKKETKAFARQIIKALKKDGMI